MTRPLKHIKKTRTSVNLLISSACALFPISVLADIPTKPSPDKRSSIADSKIKKSSIEIAQSIYGIMKHYQITQDIDKRSIEGKNSNSATSQKTHPLTGEDELIHHIAQFVEGDRKIPFLLVGFPFKSANHKSKVLSDTPDMAERKSFEYLHSMILHLSHVYPKGAEITILCDGIPFGEFVNLSDETVLRYEDLLKKLASDLPSLKLITSVDLLKLFSLDSMDDLKTHIDRYKPSNEEFHLKLAQDPHLQDTQKTMMGRLAIEFDSLKGQAYLSSLGSDALNQVTSALMAREMRLRSFIEDRFPASQYIRLTVHYSQNVHKKFGIKLSPSSTVTPYHGVLVDDLHGRWSIQFRKDIDLKNYAYVSQIVNGVKCGYMRKIA